MSTTTTNYGLIKPDTTDPILIGQLNDNMDTIDAALKENADAIENKPDVDDIPTPSTAAPSMDGTAAAGTSTDYARADHIHPSDTSKQDALTAAQLAAANSGINSTKVEQIETNKNNIILIEEANGTKNFIAPTIAQTVTRTDGGANITITRNADNSLTINGTMGTANIAVGIESSKEFSAGQYVFSGVPSASVDGVAMYISYSGGYYATIGDGQKTATVTFYSGSTYGTAILLKKNPTGSTYSFNNLKLYPMIQTKASYDAGFTDYQPYALSNAELTAAIQAIQAQLANQ